MRYDRKLIIVEDRHDESYKIDALQKKCLRLQSIIDRMEVSAKHVVLFS